MELLGKLVQFTEAVTWGWGRRERKTVDNYVLYHFYCSPYSFRVRKAAVKLGLNLAMAEILSDETAWKELISQGRRDRVPCLRIQSPSGTRWMYESKEIVSYLKTLSPLDIP